MYTLSKAFSHNRRPIISLEISGPLLLGAAFKINLLLWVSNYFYGDTPKVRWKLRRFVEKEWSYGFECESGLMIGYVQSMEFEDILHWVNHYAVGYSLPSLILKGKWQKSGISCLENRIDRPGGPISPFKLEHLWADLR